MVQHAKRAMTRKDEKGEEKTQRRKHRGENDENRKDKDGGGRKQS